MAAMKHRTLLVLALVLPAAAGFAQPRETDHQHDRHDAKPATASPYAGEEGREIKALSAQEQRAWIEGQGAGLARAAELTGYPGPMHVLEHAQQLRLTPQQEAPTRALLERHKTDVRALGRELVDLERQLDRTFSERRASQEEVSRLAQQIGALQGRIRASHLRAHVEQTALLSAQQIEQYQQLRGYRR